MMRENRQTSQTVDLWPIMSKPAGGSPEEFGVIQARLERPAVVTLRMLYPGPQYGPDVFAAPGQSLPDVTVVVHEGRDASSSSWKWPRQAWVRRDLVFQASSGALNVAVQVTPLGATDPVRCRLAAWMVEGFMSSHEWHGRLWVYQNQAQFVAGASSTNDTSIPPGCSAVRVLLPVQGGFGAALSTYPLTMRVRQANAFGVTIYTHQVNRAATVEIPLDPSARFVWVENLSGVILPWVPCVWVRHA